MIRKDQKRAITPLAVLSIGWGLGLDRFYEGKTRDGFLALIGWALIFTSLMFLSPCHGYNYAEGTKSMAQNVNPLIALPLGLGAYGIVLIIRKGLRLLRQFESAND